MTKVLPNVRGRRGHSQRDAGKNGTLMLALQTEEGATSRGVLTGTKSWERRGLDSLPELLGEDGPANTLVSAFWPPEL